MAAINMNKDSLTSQIAHMKKQYGKVARDVAVLKEKYKELLEREKFYKSHVALHLAEVSRKENDTSIFINDQKLMLHKDQLNALVRHLECLGISSIIEIKQLMVSTSPDSLDSEEEHNVPDTMSLSEENKQVQEKGIFKTMLVICKIGQFDVETRLSFHHLPGGSVKCTAVPHVEISPEILPDCIQIMYQACQPFEASILSHFLSSLHYFEILKEHREETASMLEASAHVETIKLTEPWVLECSPEGDQVISINWGISFDRVHMRLFDEISINCSDEALAFYSNNQEIFVYLSDEKKLKAASDVINFLELFS